MYDFSVLRDMRKRRKLTLERLSQVCGVSYVALSRLERNQSNPELKTLDRISKALGLATHTFLAMARREEPITASQRKCHVLGKSDCRFMDLSGVRVFVIQAPKGTAGDEPSYHHDDYERCFVLDGQVKVTVRGKDYLLGAGEGLTWDTLFDHRYEVMQPSLFIKMLTPKTP